MTAIPTSLSARLALACAVGVLIGLPATAGATDLYAKSGWSALASDRPAQQVGDGLTVLIYENSTASNSAQSASTKDTRLGGSVAFGSHNDAAQLSLSGGYDGNAQSGRAGSMVGQISVTVDEVLPNGDLRVSGEQVLNINGDRTKIHLKGRVRRIDISSDNTVLSTRLADAMIDYDGTGFVGRGARQGVVTRIFSWLGLI